MAQPLQTLPREQGIALLRQHRPDLSDADADALAAELGDLPLALYLAGSFLERYRTTTPAAYLQQVRSPDLLNHPSLTGTRLKQEHNPTQHDLHIGRSFAMSYTQLDASDTIDALALHLLARAAHFAAGEPIPRDLLLATLERDTADPERLMDAEDGLQRLSEVGLLEIGRQDGSLTLHRLLAAFVQQAAPDTEAQAAVERVMRSISYDLLTKGIPAPLVALQPHLRHITAAALVRGDEDAATLANNLGYHLKMIGDYAAARPLSERALAIREQMLGSDHPDTATSLNNLAELLRATGDYAAARPLYERALAIREQVLGSDHPDTATSLNNLAGLLHTMGNSSEALPLLERALAIKEQVLGSDHPDIAPTILWIATIYQAQGDYAAARPLKERALAIREQVLGSHHPDTASSLNNLAINLYYQQDYAAALPLMERAVAITMQRLGAQHPDTQGSLQSLAAIRQAAGGGQDLEQQLLAALPPELRALLGVSTPEELEALLAQHPELQAALAEATHTMAEQVAEQHPELRLAMLLGEWINTPTWDESRAYLEAHPALLDPTTDAVLADMLRHFQGNAGAVQTLQQHAALLQACRAEGIAAAYARVGGGVGGE